MAKSTGHSMAVLVATERHLWLNLSGIKECGKDFLLDGLVSPKGLFGKAVTTVIRWFQESKKQAPVFSKILPLKNPQKDWGMGHDSQTKPALGRMDLMAVIISKKASAKKS